MCHDAQATQIVDFFAKHVPVRNAARDAAVEVLAQGGSDRVFYRVRSHAQTYVVMHDPAGPDAVGTYVAVGRFLGAQDIGAPEIRAWDEHNGLVLMEDLGNVSLYAWAAAVSRDSLVGRYREVIDFLVHMQGRTAGQMGHCPELAGRTFGYDAFRWETSYFRDWFLNRLCGLDAARDGALDAEFHRLAADLDRERRCFMHRDFQSQNIYIKQGRIRIIDFQTATQGLPHYDLVSLLKDAYVVLSASERDALLSYYYERAGWRLAGAGRERFENVFHMAGLQRNMQALGAFGFLGLNKGKTSFLQHIPAALSYVREALEMLPEFPALARVADRAQHCLARHNDGLPGR